MAGFAVIAAVQDGHVGTGWLRLGSEELPTTCRLCKEPWPCGPIRSARAVSPRIDGQWKREEAP